MTDEQFKDMIQFNEPTFGYKGQEYSICSPDGKYYVYSSDNPSDSTLAFSNVDDLLSNWMIQGKPLGTILEEIDLN